MFDLAQQNTVLNRILFIFNGQICNGSTYDLKNYIQQVEVSVYAG